MIRFQFDVFALNLMLLYEKFDVFEMSLAGNIESGMIHPKCGNAVVQSLLVRITFALSLR